MANFTKDFVNPYPSGWQDLPSEDTPMTADALQRHTNAIEHIEQYLHDNPIESGGSSISVIDNLESTSATDALSANQGRVLHNDITTLNDALHQWMVHFNKFEQTNNLYIDCNVGFAVISVYGFMQNVGSFAIDLISNASSVSIIDRMGTVAQSGFLRASFDSSLQKIVINSDTSKEINGIYISYTI